MSVYLIHIMIIMILIMTTTTKSTIIIVLIIIKKLKIFAIYTLKLFSFHLV